MSHICMTILNLCGCRYGSSYVSTMSRHMDHMWIPVWILFRPLYESCESTHVGPHINSLWMYVQIYMDPIWMLYGSIYEVPKARNSNQMSSLREFMTHESLTIRAMPES